MSAHAGGSSAVRIVPWTLVVALCVLLGSAVYKLASQPRSHEFAPPLVSDPDQPIAAWLGEFLDGEARVEVRIAPLHADPERQHFEDDALRRRLELGEGGAWRMTLRRASPGFAEDAWARRRFEIADAHGTALASLALESAPNGPSDPLRVSLAPWISADGRVVSAVLWGRAPEQGASWRAEGGPTAQLQRGSVHRSELEVPLARLDARGAGNKSAAQASETQRGVDPSERR